MIDKVNNFIRFYVNKVSDFISENLAMSQFASKSRAFYEYYFIVIIIIIIFIIIMIITIIIIIIVFYDKRITWAFKEWGFVRKLRCGTRCTVHPIFHSK